jgi:DNA-binding MarR family transcriptional regulator
MQTAKHSLLDQLYHTTFDIGRLMRQRMLEHMDGDMNPIQGHALMVVEQHPAMTMSELAKCLHMTSPSATSLVNRLVRHKLLVRRHDRLNRKLVRLTLTPAGKRMIQRMNRLHAEVITTMFGHLDEPQLRVLIQLHRSMLERANSTSSSF